MLSFYYAGLADLNVGILTSVWSFTQLLIAAFDFIINGQRLTNHHLIGMAFLIISTLGISISGIFS
jgi:drug/metabolite transporter (DMT)-like permease